MKMNIQITKIGTGLRTNEEIVNIDICNGNWKYNDWYMETDEKISLTMNNITEAEYLHYPVKDAYPHYDMEKARKYELEVIDASIRSYDSLHKYLVYRINNCKEDYKEHGWTERTFNIILFDEKYVKSDEQTVVKDIVYENQGLCEVKITVVE